MKGAFLFALVVCACATLVASNNLEVEGGQPVLDCQDLRSCLKCTQTGDNYSFDASGCKSGSSLSWMCLRGLGAVGLGQCSGSQDQNKCDDFLTTTYQISGSTSKIEVQVHDGRLCGDYKAEGQPNSLGLLAAKSTCGGSGGGCGKDCTSCVCSLRLSDVCKPAPTCSAIGNTATYTTSCSSGPVPCGGTCSLTCLPGYSGASTMTCDASGAWTGSYPTCAPNKCDAIPDGGVGSSSYTSGCKSGIVSSGTKCELSCSKPGFFGSSTQSCHLGSWTGSPPECIPGISCQKVRDCAKCMHKGMKVEIDLSGCSSFCNKCQHSHSLGWMGVSKPAGSTLWGCDGEPKKAEVCTDVQRAAWRVEGDSVTIQLQDDSLCGEFDGDAIYSPSQGLEGCTSGICELKLNINDPDDCDQYDPEVDPPIIMNDRPCVINRRVDLVERKEQKGTQRILTKMMPQV